MFLWIIIYLVILLLLLGVGIGIGFLLQWLFPETNIGIAILTGLISTGIRTADADALFLYTFTQQHQGGRRR